MWQPARKFWDAVKGNIYFWLIGVTFSALGGSAAVTSIWKHIQSYRGLPSTDSRGLFILCLLISCLLVLTWVAARREVNFRTNARLAISLPPSLDARAIRSGMPKKPEAPLLVDLQGEVLEVYFYSPQNFLAISTTHILCKVRIVNQGPDQATITHCALEISLGDFRQMAENEDIVPSWHIKRKKQGTLGIVFEETAIEPRLGNPPENEVYVKGVPRTGWLAFQFYNYGDREFPNADLKIHLKDSLGGVHCIHREPMVYERAGEIVVAT